MIDEQDMELANKLTAEDFTAQNVLVKLEDNSEARFRYAFAQPETHDGERYIVVYTEHSGYHAFRKSSVKRVEHLPDATYERSPLAVAISILDEAMEQNGFWPSEDSAVLYKTRRLIGSALKELRRQQITS